MKAEYDHKCQIIIIGDSTVGKTSFLSQYMGHNNPLKQTATVGIDYFSKDIKIDTAIVRTKIWDTAGQERFRSITDSFYKSANGVILVFDLNNKDTFTNLKVWVQSISLKASKNIKKILIGNKSDLEREIGYDEAAEFAKNYDLNYFEASAKENINVESTIIWLIKEILNSGGLVEEKTKTKENSIKINKKKDKCC